MAIMNETELSNQLNKLLCFQEIIEEDLKEMNKNINNINNYYKTNNTNQIQQIQTYQNQQITKMTNNFFKYQYVMKYNIEKHKKTARNMEELFENNTTSVKSEIK